MITTHFFILKNILHLSFEQILHYCRDDVSVNRAVLQTLYTIYSNAHPKNKSHILDFENYAFEHMKIGLKHEVDIQNLEDVRIHEQEEEQSELDSGAMPLKFVAKSASLEPADNMIKRSLSA